MNGQPHPLRSLVFFGRDFMIGSRIEGVARAHSLVFRRVEKKENLETLSETPAIVLFDLAATGEDLPSMVSTLRSGSRETVLAGLAFHTDQQSLDKGRQAGLDRLITRSALVDALNKILSEGG